MLLVITFIMIFGVMNTTPQSAKIESPLESSPAQPRYHLKASGNGRYLVDQNYSPVFLAGDAPQDAFALLNEPQ